MSSRRAALALLAIAVVAVGCTGGTTTTTGSPSPTSAPSGTTGIDKLQHLIFIVQENRSFDQYFGTYPGADGIPTNPDGSFSVCVPDKFQGGACVPPYVTRSIDQDGGPHNHEASVRDVDGGTMDGFIDSLPPRPTKCWTTPTLPDCDVQLGPQGQPDVMSTQRRAAIPNYWAYADHYALQDHMFAPVDSWTLPSHLFLVSEWSAACSNPNDPMSCHTDINLSDPSLRWDYGKKPVYAWTDLTWLMDEQQVAWRYYVGNDTCEEPPCPSTGRKFYGTSYNRNPLPGFSSFGERQGDGGSWKDNVLPVERLPVLGGRRHAARRGVDRAGVQRLGPPRRTEHDPHRDGVRHPAGERRDAGSGLGLHRDLPDVGRLGRVLRPRGAQALRRDGLRAARARARDQPVGQAGVHRPHGRCRSTPTRS